MASLKEPVSFSGILKGQDLESTCIVHAEKVSLPNTDVFEYTKMKTIKVAADLPEGIYQLTVGGKSFAVRFEKGEWVSAS